MSLLTLTCVLGDILCAGHLLAAAASFLLPM